MKQIITWQVGGSTASGAGTRFTHPFDADTQLYFEGQSTCIWSTAGTFSNMAMEHDIALPSGVTCTYTLMINGVASALTFGVTYPAVTGSDTTHSVAVAAGDNVSIRRVITGGTPGSNWDASLFYLEFDSSGTANNYSNRFDVDLSSGEAYGAPFFSTGVFFDWMATAADCTRPMPMAGTVTRIDLENFNGTTSSNSPGALPGGQAVQFTLIKNGVEQDGTGGTTDTRVSLTSAAATASWTGSLSFAAGDTMAWVVRTTSGTVSLLRAAAGFTVEPTVAGTFMLGLGTLEVQLNWLEALTQPYRYAGMVFTDGAFNVPASWPRFSSVPVLTEFYITQIRGLASVTGTLAAGLRVMVNGAAAANTPRGTFAYQVDNGNVHVMLAMTAVAPSSGSYAVVGVGQRFAAMMLKETMQGSAVFGVTTTVTAPRAVAFGLDGNTNVHATSGVCKIFGDLEVTGDLDVTGGVIDVSADLDGLGT